MRTARRCSKSRRSPFASGRRAWLLPLGLLRHGMRQAADAGRPAVLYFHPWEFDPDMPRLPLSWLSRWRTYVGVRRARGKLGRLLQTPARWSTIEAELGFFHRLADETPPLSLEDVGRRKAA